MFQWIHYGIFVVAHFDMGRLNFLTGKANRHALAFVVLRELCDQVKFLSRYNLSSEPRMSNITYDLLWRETMRDLLDMLELDPPQGY
jgi:hypothetical protein